MRLLIVEDRPEDAELMVHALRRSGFEPDWKRVDREDTFLAALADEPDIVFCDYLMPQFGAARALELLKARNPDIPVIIVSGSIGEDLAVAAMRHGASDYLLKDRLARLGEATHRALERRRLSNEARQAIAALKESEERLRAAFDQAAVGMALRGTDPRQPRWLRVNQRFCDILGYSREELLQLTSVDVTPPDERDVAIAYNEKLLRGEIGGYSREKRYVRKDGRIIWAYIALAAVRDSDGRPTHVMAVIQDVTERKRLEEETQRKGRLTQLLESLAREANEAVTPQAAMRRCMERVLEHGGWRLGCVVTFAPGRSGSVPQTTFWQAPDPGRFSEFMRRSDGTDHLASPGYFIGRVLREKRPVWLSDLTQSSLGRRMRFAVQLGLRSAFAFPVVVDDEVAAFLEFFAEDTRPEDTLLIESIGSVAAQLARLIERERSYEALRRSEERLDSILSGLSEVVWSIAAAGALLYINPACVEVYGHTADEFRNDISLWRKAVHPDDEARVGSWAERWWTHDSSEIDYRIIRADGAVRWVHDRARVIRDPQGAPLRLDGIVIDITERKEAEEKIARLNRVYAVLSGINTLIVRVRDRKELLDGACRIAVDQGGFGIAWIGMLKPDAPAIVPVAWAGVDSEWFSQNADLMREGFVLGNGLIRRAISEKRAAHSNDILTEPTPGAIYRQEAVRRGYRSLVVLPLAVDGGVVGTISLFAKEPDLFNDDELRLLEELAGDISFSLQTIEKQEKLDYLSYYDQLTGLPNRALFIDRLSQQLHSRSDEDVMIALILLDLDRFTTVNETLGHQGGDALLKEVASRLEAAFGGNHSLARIGGDGFGIVLRGVQDLPAVARVTETTVLGSFQKSFVLDATELRVSVTAGISLYPADANDAEALFRNAEAAMRRAKASSERYLFYSSEMNAQADRLLALETRLRAAVEEGQFVLYYQPKIELADGRLSGVEALMRWNDPENGIIPPIQFIPLLEQTGMILEAGRWAIQQALADQREWRAQGFQPPRVAVNVSPIQLRRPDFVEAVRTIVRESGVEPSCLELEITEGLIMENIEGNIEKLRALRSMGISIAIDDFGTGYSSLGYLARLPVNALKIDRSFINTMADNADSMTIVSTIISLAHSLSLKVVAEGVDSEEQRKFLRLLKCDEIQGYLVSKPMPASDVTTMLL